MTQLRVSGWRVRSWRMTPPMVVAEAAGLRLVTADNGIVARPRGIAVALASYSL